LAMEPRQASNSAANARIAGNSYGSRCATMAGLRGSVTLDDKA
jgi:hypothetical protein